MDQFEPPDSDISTEGEEYLGDVPAEPSLLEGGAGASANAESSIEASPTASVADLPNSDGTKDASQADGGDLAPTVGPATGGSGGPETPRLPYFTGDHSRPTETSAGADVEGEASPDIESGDHSGSPKMPEGWHPGGPEGGF